MKSERIREKPNHAVQRIEQNARSLTADVRFEK